MILYFEKKNIETTKYMEIFLHLECILDVDLWFIMLIYQ